LGEGAWTGATWIALALGLAGALFVARSGQGTVRGAFAGLVVAAAAILGLGPGALAPLAVFVLGAGALTRLGRERKERMGTAEGNRGRRDSRHVAAKLGLPALLGLAALATRDREWLQLAYAGSLAGALADTAATEVGPLARGPAAALAGARLKRAAHGDAGAMSAAGLAAAALGSAAVAAGAAISGLVAPAAIPVLAAAGLAATVVESLVAGSGRGRALGHFGRNALVSVAAAALAIAGALGLGLD
jgi:uncharacterized membrane protein